VSLVQRLTVILGEKEKGDGWRREHGLCHYWKKRFNKSPRECEFLATLRAGRGRGKENGGKRGNRENVGKGWMRVGTGTIGRKEKTKKRERRHCRQNRGGSERFKASKWQKLL